MQKKKVKETTDKKKEILFRNVWNWQPKKKSLQK